jgi:hypothetical protein
MKMLPSRRRFAGEIAGVSAAVVTLGAVPMQSALASTVPSSLRSPVSSSAELMSSIGERIGRAAVAKLGVTSYGTQLSVAYLNASPEACSGLVCGLKAALKAAGASVSMHETITDSASFLAVAVIRNQSTGQALRVEVFPSSLSQVAYVEALGVDSIPADALYWMSPLNS